MTTEKKAVYAEQIDPFIASLRRRNNSPRTQQARRDDLMPFVRWLDEQHGLPLLQARLEHVEEFLDSKSAWSGHQLSRFIGSLRGFYEWAIDHDLLTRSPVRQLRAPKLPRRMPRPIATRDLHKILWIAARRGDHYDLAWLTLGAMAGLRCIEMANLRGEDIDLAAGRMLVRGKGGHERIVPMHPKVRAALSNLTIPAQGPVFVTQRKPVHPFSASAISVRINDYLTMFGIDATAHQLRHWFGTHIYRATKDLRVTQELMGHRSPNTTAGYAAHDPAEGRMAVAMLSSPLTRKHRNED